MFKRILKLEGISAKMFSEKIDLGYKSYRTIISKGSVPRWVRAFVFGYGVGLRSNEPKSVEDCCPKCGMESYLVNVMGCRDLECPETEGVGFKELTPEEIKEFDTKALYIDPKTLEDENI